MSNPSLITAAAAKRAPSMQSILDTDPAIEMPEEQGRGRLLALKKPEKVQLTPLHVNIPVTLDAKIRKAMDSGVEKTSIVCAALETFLGE